ncbi:hypothetical protein ISR94_00645 [Candidatus Microgenomates bacterium]|nr:hypothetical protein [Candidatus Microgenomates bacterium]
MKTDRLSRIESGVGNGALDIRPAETVLPVSLTIIDEVSLALQDAGKKAGVEIPDVRLRVFTNIETDEIHGFHFGTLSGAVKKAEAIIGKKSSE